MNEWMNKYTNKWINGIIVPGNICLFVFLFIGKIPFPHKELEIGKEVADRGQDSRSYCCVLIPISSSSPLFPSLTSLHLSDFSASPTSSSGKLLGLLTNQIPLLEALTALCPHYPYPWHSDNFTLVLLCKYSSVFHWPIHFMRAGTSSPCLVEPQWLAQCPAPSSYSRNICLINK